MYSDLEQLFFYERLSIEDYDVDDESNSIANQKKLISEFVRNNIELNGIPYMDYSDDGYTGSNFNRPDFQKMLEEIRICKSSCLIIKDLSRLGRSYLEVGMLLKITLPSLNCRVISILDDLDSKRYELSSPDMDVAFKNLMNDIFCKMTSRSIKSVFYSKQKRGEFLGGYPPYGILINEKKQLIIDESVRSVIKKIFNDHFEGKAGAKIAREINDLGIPTPRQYFNIIYGTSLNRDRESGWDGNKVLLIIRNIVYKGDFAQRKTEIKVMSTNKVRKKDVSEWVIHENFLEPIISRELFDKAQLLLKPQKNAILKRKIEYPKKYVGMIKCGCCGHNLTFRLGKKDQEVYYCRKYNFIPHEVDYVKTTEQEIDRVVSNAIRMQLEIANDYDEFILCMEEKQRKIEKDRMDSLEAIQEEYEMFRKQRNKLYFSYADKEISKENYLRKKEELDKRVELIEKRLEVAQYKKDNVKEELEKIPSLYNKVRIYDQNQLLRKEVIDGLIKEIKYFSPNYIEIIWNFCNELSTVFNEILVQ